MRFPFLDGDVPRHASYGVSCTFRNLLGLLESAITLRPGISIVGQLTESVESSFLIHHDVYHDLSVCS